MVQTRKEEGTSDRRRREAGRHEGRRTHIAISPAFKRKAFKTDL